MCYIIIDNNKYFTRVTVSPQNVCVECVVCVCVCVRVTECVHIWSQTTFAFFDR